MSQFSTATPLVAIETRYLGPTNYRGARIVATTGNGHRMVVPYDYAMGGFASHRLAAQKLAERLAWNVPSGVWHPGATALGYVFVRVDQ